MNFSYSRMLLISFVGFGILIGLIFPYFVAFFVTIEGSKEIYFAISCVTAGVILGVINYFIYRAIIGNILFKLSSTFDLVSKGNLQVHCTIRSNDAIGEMANTLNKMIIQLQGIMDEVSRKAYEDPLTKLPNRYHMYTVFQHCKEHSDRHKSNLAILFFDLDKFKKINDTYGHEIGDKLLIEVAKNIKENIRREDTLVRFGGDEFIVLLSQIDSMKTVETVAGKIVDVFNRPFYLVNKSVSITTSIGIAIYPQHGADLATLISRADYAMYEAKKLGGSRYVYCQKSV